MTPPNPGSDEARAKGCICPVLDNAHGRGWMGVEGSFVYREGCPVHPSIPIPEGLPGSIDGSADAESAAEEEASRHG